MADIRKIIIIFVVAILFSVLVFSIIDAVYPAPLYEQVCKDDFYTTPSKPIAAPPTENFKCGDLNISDEEQKSCQDRHGVIIYRYDEHSCPDRYLCSTCSYDFDQAMKKHNQFVFYISAFLSLVAIFIGLYLPAEQNTLNEWIGTGFMLGGAVALLFGTAVTFQALDRFIRPIVIFVELCVVIFIAYRKIGNLRK